MRAMGVRTVKQGKFLGVDYGAGSLVKLTHSKDRLKNCMARNARAGVLGRYAQLHVFKTGLMPTVRHGTTVHGASMSLILKVRQAYGVSARAEGAVNLR